MKTQSKSKTIARLHVAVTGVNKHLKDSVKTMTPIILLRNCGYEDRDFYAKALYHEGIITREESAEFLRYIIS